MKVRIPRIKRTGHHVSGHYKFMHGHRIHVAGHHRMGCNVKGHTRSY